jgi:signal transduction histidine kinase
LTEINITMLKVSRALSEEIVLGKLIEKLIQIAIEHAGAERGVLILLRNGEPQITAEADSMSGKVEITRRNRMVKPTDLPESALKYVMRTRESLILDEASASPLFSGDEYIRVRRPKSVLCLPIIKQAQLVGALYLENNLTPHAFTPGRIPVLEFLASQAAILLENAYLYSDLQRSDALRDAQAELMHVVRVSMMGELAASIAHKVNQPLASIVTNAQACRHWLEGDQPNIARARIAVERIERDGHDAGDAIKSIRSMFRVPILDVKPLDANAVITEALNLMHSELKKHNVALETDLSGGLRRVLGDRVQLQHVIVNLVTNAIDAMSAIRDRPRFLRVRTHNEDDGSVSVVVEDSGIGLEPAKENRIFEPLYSTKPEGIGMGLAICRSIVEAHGGRLRASARPPNGSRFRFTIPALS